MAVILTYLPDILILFIIILAMLGGYKKGLVRSLTRLFAFAAAILLAWALWPLAADVLEALGIKTYFTGLVKNGVGQSLSDITGAAENLPLILKNGIDSGQQAVTDGISAAAADAAVNIIAFIAVILVSAVLITVAAKLLNLFANLPVISFFNRAAGAALGAFEGIAVVFILLAVIYAAAPLGLAAKAEPAIEASVLAGPMYENNPVIKILNLNAADSGSNGE